MSITGDTQVALEVLRTIVVLGLVSGSSTGVILVASISKVSLGGRLVLSGSLSARPVCRLVSKAWSRLRVCGVRSEGKKERAKGCLPPKGANGSPLPSVPPVVWIDICCGKCFSLKRSSLPRFSPGTSAFSPSWYLLRRRLIMMVMMTRNATMAAPPIPTPMIAPVGRAAPSWWFPEGSPAAWL